jgi:hypothetical protein
MKPWVLYMLLIYLARRLNLTPIINHDIIVIHTLCKQETLNKLRRY